MSKAHLTGNWLMTATVCSFLFLLLLLLALEPGSLRAQTTSPTVPGAPKYIEGVRQDGRIWVHWGSPHDDGGAVVTGYDLRYIRSDADTTVDGNWTIKLAVSTVAGWDYVMGLTNGVEYHVQVRAVNEVGAGAWSVSFTAAPVEHPSPPVINSVTPGEGTLTVSWSAPEDDGGSDITEYRVRHIRSDAPGKPFIAWTEKRGISGSTLQYVIGGLTIGVRYDVQVRATNASGGGSDYSATVTGIPEERTVPSAPAISSVISFNEKLNIVWDAPSGTGGTIITAYDLRYIRSDAPDKADDNWTVLDSIWTSGTRAYGLGGLTNWVGYDVQVRAENSEGTGPWSATTTGTPGNLPSAPTIVKLFDIPGYFQVDWSAPADNGGAAIIDYHIRLTRGAGTRVYDDLWEPGDPLAQGFEAPGSSTEFGVEVRAVNPAGPGPWSAMVTFTTGSISAPVMVAGSPGDGQILVTWQAPDKGADGITTYDLRYIRSDADKSVGANWFLGEGKWSSGPLQYTITGLDNGVEYDVQVRAVRGLVRGPWSASTTATLGTTLASPTINSLTPGDGALVVAWSAPANSGDVSITGYDLRYIRSDESNKADANWTVKAGIWSSGTLRCDLAGLTNGVGYEVQVRGVNSVGAGAWSASGIGKPRTTPEAPSINSLTPGEGTLAVAWSAPGDDGGADITSYGLRYIRSDAPDKADANWTEEQDAGSSASLEYTITGLTNGVEYAVRVIAVNDVGDGPPSDEATATPRETTPPELATATVDGTTLTLSYDEALDENSEPSSDAFSVTVGGTGRAIDGVSEKADTVTLTLASAVTAEETVTVSYAAPADTAAPRIRDLAGNAAASFSDQDVENNTPPPANSPATGAPTISGTAQVGETLTAETRDIEDDDGLDNAVFTYQWLADDAEIAGATSDTYTLVADDVGKAIKVRVIFRDNRNLQESLTSAATAVVVVADTTSPTVTSLQWLHSTDGTDDIYTIGDELYAWVEFSEWVSNRHGEGTPRLRINLEDDKHGYGQWDTSWGEYNFIYRVTEGVMQSQGVSTGANPIELNGGDIEDAAGNDAILDHPGIPANGEFVIDGVRPKVESLAITSDPGEDKTYGVGDVIEVSVTFSEDVRVPSLRGIIDGEYGEWFPVLTLQIGDQKETADFFEFNYTVVKFTYTVAVGDSASNGIAIPQNALSFNNGILEDDVGTRLGSSNAANLDHSALTADSGHIVHAPARQGGLRLLELSGIPLAFDPAIDNYSAHVANEVMETTVTATANDHGATYVVQLGGVTDDDRTVSLAVGENVITIEVTAEDDTTTRTYTITVTRSSNTPATGAPTISGTAQVGETLTADISGIDDADGLPAESEFDYQWIRNDGSTDANIAGATYSTYVLLAADVGKFIKVRVTFTDKNDYTETLTSAATSTVVTPLTAGFRGAPDKHLGTGVFTFDIAFSEPISIGYVTLRDDSLDVTNGSATKARRVDGQSDLWEITVDPDSDADVTVVLPITENCAAQDAVCTRDGTKLSNRSELTVPGPAAANSPATGLPTISGTAQVGETLTVDTSGIDDADGIGNATFSYQWIAGTTDISGATGSSYAPLVADLGKPIKVRVSFDDDDDNEETLTSEATATVIAAVTPLTAGFQDAPDKHLGTGVFTFEIAFSEPISIGYKTLRDDSLEVTNGSATRAKRVDGQSDRWQITVDPDSDAAVTVVLPVTEDCESDGAVCTRDGTKLSNRSELTVPGPAAANSPATGAPIISGTARVGETLTVDTLGIDDADGMSGAVFSYQWLADGVDIAGATGDTYTLVDADFDKAVKVRVIFNDDDDNEETLTSAATAAVAAETAVPDAPQSLNVSPDDTGTLDVSWEAPSSDGGSDITGYKVQWKSGSEDYDGSAGSTRQAEITDPASRTHTITGLTDGVEYAVRVIAVNDVGDGPPSDEATGTPGETTPPELSTATVDGATLTLTYDEALDEASGLAADAFSVTVGGTGRAVDGVSVSGSSVILTLGSEVASGATVTVSYAAPADTAAPRIQDDAGNPAASFSDQAVVNNTPPPPNTPVTGAPTISGTARVGETLTAETSAIADADGLDNVGYSYQWLANGADIAGATDPTYTLVDDDAGKAIQVKVSFRDDKNNPETLTSAATAAVEPRPNSPATGAPTISGTVRVGETLTAGTSAIADADGMSGAVFIYHWLANGADIAGATNNTYTLVDTDVGKTIKVRVIFTDNADNEETLTSAATAVVEPRPNTPATGAPTISGTAQVGETLTVDTSGIADADGMSGAVFSYQWLANGADVAGATSDTYTPVADDFDKAIKVKVSFRDDRNHQESLTSAATAAVTAAADESAVWSATLTVGSSGSFHGYWKDFMGSLAPDGFNIDGSDYTVTSLNRYGDLMFAFVLDQALPGDFTLQVGDTTLRSEEAEVTTSSSSYSYQWQNKIPALSDGDIVEVSLTLAE